MNCQNADHLIQKSLDEPLSRSERTQLDAHLASCASCQVAWDEYRTLARSTSAWIAEASASTVPDAAFTAQLLTQITAQAEKPQTAPRVQARWLWGSAAVACGLIAASSLAAPWISLRLTMTPNWLTTLTALHDLPQWLIANVHDTLASITMLSTTLPHNVSVPTWTTSVLLAALLVNGFFFWRTITLNRRQIAS